jgi:hypothetical protein
LVARNVERLVEVGNKMMVAGGGSPALELIAETQQLGARIQMGSRMTLVLLAIAVFAMATARYW